MRCYFYILLTFLPLDCSTSTFYYINDTLMRAHTSCHSHLMEVRPNSHPERTGPYMTGTDVDFSVSAHRSADISPDRTPECWIERLITKRTQRLKDDRQNLKDRLHSYIALRSIQKWSPPRHHSFNLFNARLKSFTTWPRRTELPTTESLAEAGFYYEGMCSFI